MKIGFIINDLNSMNLEKDTSVYLMKEAHARGDDIFAACGQLKSKTEKRKKSLLYSIH